MPEFNYSDLLPIGPDKTKYRLVTTEGVSTFTAEGMEFLKVTPEAIEKLTAEAIHDINHYLREEHLTQLASILKDPEASPNDRFVALDLLKNANISAGGVLPMCQDTGTALIMGKKGQRVLTSKNDAESISQGVYDAYTTIFQLRSKFIQIPSTLMNITSYSLQKVAAAQINHSFIKRQKQF